MENFTLGENFNGEPVYCIAVDGYLIFNPYVSECGRFTVDPMETYGIEPIEAAKLRDLNRFHGYDDTL